MASKVVRRVLVAIASLMTVAARSHAKSGLHDPIGSVQGLIGRVLGQQYVNSFQLEVIPTVGGEDVFQLDASGSTVVIRGSAGYAISAGLGWYLKYTCNASVSWGRGASGNNVALPSPGQLPLPTPQTQLASVQWRYAYNVCTYGYSMAWWNFTQFEEEIDRLALWGVNLPLAFQGQEYTWDRFWRSVGLNETELGSWFAGPAFLPWNRMGNMQGWGGPLNPFWLAQQKDMQVNILTRMRSFGMTPVLPGFAGHVPRAIKNHFPDANTTNSPDWCGFQPQYGSDALLEPTDKLYMQLATTFHQMVLADFGDPTGQEAPIFNADMFNEMAPNSGDLAYLTACNAATYGAMQAVNNRSVYMMQAWLFHEDFWTPARVQAYLAGVPIGNMLILDLNTEASPVWQEYSEFYGHEWLWNSLITYGGRRGIYGDLDRMATSPYADKNNSKHMVGIGFTPEATEMIPSQFDIIMEAGWRNVSTGIPDPVLWLQQWAGRRYGGTGGVMSPSMQEAYAVLAKAAFNSPIDTATVELYPSIGDGMSHNTNATGILEALRLFVAAAANGELDRTLGTYSYDLTDLHRQFIINYWSDAHAMLASRYTAAMSNSSSSASRRLTVTTSVHAGGNGPEVKSATSASSNGLKEWRDRLAAVGRVPTVITTAAAGSSSAIESSSGSGSISANASASVYAIASLCSTLLADLDTALAADLGANFLLGNWIGDAARWGCNVTTGGDCDANMTAQWVFNARNQVTLWGPNGEINDYAAKNGWSGLVSSYYLGRYSILFRYMNESVASGGDFNQSGFDAECLAFEKAWSNQTDDRPPTTPSGADPVVLAQQTLATYATFDGSKWKALPNTDVQQPPKSKSFVQVGPPDHAAVSADCPYTGKGDGSSLPNCETSCIASASCTAINWNAGIGDCVFRLCANPLHPQISPGYPGYTTFGLNQTAGPAIFTAWHTDTGVLSSLCAADPTGCGGFNSNGVLYTDVSSTVSAPGVTLYVPA